MRKTYGNTWWGRKWLDSLKGIDYSNRLPRGRTYANKGAVLEVEIKGNLIKAAVAGSRPRPYQVELSFSNFTKQQKKQIVTSINENPLLLSKLLNREMPSELADLCNDLNIPLFPSSWNDLKGTCTCPDWAVPCKHLAASLYVVSTEIDQNPFLIFDLHDFNLISALEDKSVGVLERKDLFIKDANSLMEPFIKKGNKEFDPDLSQQLDFSILKSIKTDFLQILSDHPPFYQKGDFKKILQKVYEKLRKQQEKDVKASKEKVLSNVALGVEQVEILLDQDLSYLTTTGRNSTGDELLHLDTSHDLMEWLNDIPIHQYGELSDALQCLLLTYQFARQLVLQSAFIPELIKVGEDEYRLRWIPANLNDKIKLVSKQMEELILPKNLLFYRKEKTFLSARPEDTLSAIANIFLSDLISKGHGLAENILLEKVGMLFFQNEIQHFSSFKEQSIPGAIQLWLNKFFLGAKDYIPIIQVEDAGDQGFAISILIEDSQQKLLKPIPLSELFADTQYSKIRLTIIRDLSMLSDFFPQIGEIIKARGRKVLLFDHDAFVPVLFKLLPSIQLLGIKVLLPKALRKLSRPRLSMSLDTDVASGHLANKKNQLSLNQLLTFEWKIAIGDQHVSLEEFKKLAGKYTGIIRLNDQYVFFDEAEIHKLITQLVAPPDPTAQELLKSALTEEYEDAGIQLSPRVQKLMRGLMKTSKVKIPKGLKAKLRPYQERGYAWMYKNAQLGFGSLMADDMGLGKTLQVITLLLRFQEDGWLDDKKVLIVVPTTLLSNWEKEINRFAPELKFHTYHGPKRNLKPLEEAEILITTYGIIRTETKKLQKVECLALIIDESQHIKNPVTAQTKAIKKFNAPIKIAMSGTPVENRLSEYWSVFDFTNKGYLGSLKSFIENYAKPIELDRNQRQMDLFRKVTAPFIMRRLKSDKQIIQDLPEKIEKNQYCLLTADQASLYQSVVTEVMERIESEDGIKRKGLVLKLLTSLKQICNHPRQFLKRGVVDPAQSGKCLRLFDLLKDILTNQGKALIFTQYQEMGKLLQEMLQQQLDLSVSFLHGGVSRKNRDQMVSDFQMNRNTRLLILSLKAAGTGLNLTAANHVIHFDLWWNPAVEAQATDRAFRIGQQRNVMVHRFITKDSFEEKIDKLIQNKKELANLTVANGEKWIGDLSDNDLKDLVKI